MIAASSITAIAPHRDYWAVPWVLSIDLDGRCHLSSCTDVHERPVGTTVRMRIRREDDGLHVHIERTALAPCGYQWSRQPHDGSAWFALGIAVLWIDGARQDQVTLPEDLLTAAAAV
jgi:hypothetical protein